MYLDPEELLLELLLKEEVPENELTKDRHEAGTKTIGILITILQSTVIIYWMKALHISKRTI